MKTPEEKLERALRALRTAGNANGAPIPGYYDADHQLVLHEARASLVAEIILEGLRDIAVAQPDPPPVWLVHPKDKDRAEQLLKDCYQATSEDDSACCCPTCIKARPAKCVNECPHGKPLYAHDTGFLTRSCEICYPAKPE